MSKVVLVCGADWEGLYIDGKLKKQDHMLSADVVLDALGIEYEEVRVEGSEYWATWGGMLPAQLATVRKTPARGWPR